MVPLATSGLQSKELHYPLHLPCARIPFSFHTLRIGARGCVFMNTNTVLSIITVFFPAALDTLTQNTGVLIPN